MGVSMGVCVIYYKELALVIVRAEISPLPCVDTKLRKVGGVVLTQI